MSWRSDITGRVSILEELVKDSGELVKTSGELVKHLTDTNIALGVVVQAVLKRQDGDTLRAIQEDVAKYYDDSPALQGRADLADLKRVATDIVEEASKECLT